MKLLALFIALPIFGQMFPFPGPGPATGGGGGGGGVLFVAQSSTASSFPSATNPYSTSSQNVAAGNFVACSTRYSGTSNAVSSITDTGSANTFVLASKVVFATTEVTEIWIAWNTTAVTGDIFTVTFAAALGSFAATTCDQFSGVIISGNPKDATANGGIGGSGSVTTGTFTTVQAHELLYAVMDSGSTSGAWTPGACGSGTCALASDLSASIGVALDTQWLYVSTVQTAQTMSASSSSGGNSFINAVTFKAQ